MNRLAIQLLRLALAVLLIGTLLAQCLVPLFASQQGMMFPEVADVVIPYSVVGIVVIACGQVALLVVWRLLSMIERDVIFTRRALRGVDVITGCGVVATILTAAVMVHLLVFVGVGGPGVVLGVAACLAGGLAFVLLMVVMRGLLELAITQRTELDEVI